MEKLVFVLISVTAAATPLHAQVQSGVEELAGLTAGIGTALYRRVASTSDDNIAVCPLAAVLGLASLADGAAEETRAELMQKLELASMERAGEPDRVRTLLREMRQAAAQTIATGLFLAPQFEPDPEFKQLVKGFYDTDVQSVDFSSAQKTKENINDFVTSSTGSRVREVLQVVDPQNQLLLISAAFATAPWKLPFNTTFTQDERFYIDRYHIVQVPMMTHSDKYHLAYDPRLKAGILKLPCTDGTAVLLILPDEDVDYTSVDEALTADVFLSWVERLKKTRLEVQIPRFSLDQTFSLKSRLPALGISKLLEAGADLSGISRTPGLKLSEALQKVSVEVNESGGSDGSSSYSLFKDPLPPRLVFNRPFLYIIYNEASKGLLHMGRVVDPTKK